ncbi:hypothetical protein MMYC01_207629 [Madurella mycetomatis]|uniref:Uncharacterized protein n=1 Tax=Madurella mycetomatis TaxID=100816 RepID=A0A175VVY9_9PEZI|nr:hypothetical protein MMYC01_207629 [Madurella mycetomatis]
MFYLAYRSKKTLLTVYETISLVGLTATNWSYYTVPGAFFMVLVPHTYAFVLAGKNYDINNPRKTEEHCAKDTTMDKITLRRLSRAKAATANGFETLGLYAAAVVAANAAGVPTPRLNALTLAYLTSRAVYNLVYVVLQDNARVAPLRSLAWMSGIAIITALYVSAARAVN